MRPGQREGCGAVIESGSRPIRRRVANRTVCREPGGNMIRDRSAQCRRALPSSQMAAIAGSRTQCVVVAYMARRAGGRRRRDMQSREHKPSGAVVKRCGCEAHRRVAIGAVSHCESGPGSGVRRGGGPLPAAAIVCVQVAAGISAIGRRDRQCVIVIDVAQTAGHGCMAIGQREPSRAVIKYARGPSGDRVAGRAGRSRSRESCRDVVRNVPANRCGALEGRLVAAITIRRIEAVVVADMAGGARRRRWRHMRSRQGKSGSTVIERRRSPTGGRMASRAIRHCKSRSGCGVHRRGGLLPSRQMALRISAIGRGDHQCVIAINVAQSAGHVGVPIR